MRILARSNLRAALGSQLQSPCNEVRDSELQSSHSLLNLPRCPERPTPQFNSPMAGQPGNGNTYTPLFKCPPPIQCISLRSQRGCPNSVDPLRNTGALLRGLTCRSNTPLLFTYIPVNSPKCCTRSRSTSRKTLPEPH